MLDALDGELLLDLGIGLKSAGVGRGLRAARRAGAESRSSGCRTSSRLSASSALKVLGAGADMMACWVLTGQA